MKRKKLLLTGICFLTSIFILNGCQGAATEETQAEQETVSIEDLDQESTSIESELTDTKSEQDQTPEEETEVLEEVPEEQEKDSEEEADQPSDKKEKETAKKGSSSDTKKNNTSSNKDNKATTTSGNTSTTSKSPAVTQTPTKATATPAPTKPAATLIPTKPTATPAPTKPVTTPTPTKPVATPTPTKPAATPTPTHTHTWVDITETINHPAETKTETRIIDEAWTEEVPVYEKIYKNICNGCGADITGNEYSHNDTHMLNGEKGGWHSAYDAILVRTDYVEHPAITEEVTIVTKEAWTETKVTGQKCSGCGQTK